MGAGAGRAAVGESTRADAFGQEAESEWSAEQCCPGSAGVLPRAQGWRLGKELICRPTNVVLGVKRSH